MSFPSVAIIIPVRNSEDTMRRCVDAIYASTVQPTEVVVVDDGCTDNTLAPVREFGCTIIESGEPGGVAAARNKGAEATTSEVLFFLDADVILEPHALEASLCAMEERDIDVAVGLQTERSAFPNATSVYKNLWLRYTYLAREGQFSVLYSSAVAIRRTAFDKVGGFDTHYRKPNIEDSELGKRLTEAGCKLALVRDLEFLHIKHYNLSSMLRTDFLRTVGMMKVQLRDRFRRARRENYTSIPTSFLLSCVVPWVVVPLALTGIIPRTAGWPALVLLPPLIVALLNMGWLRYIASKVNAKLALKGAILLQLDVVVVNAGVAWGALEYLFGRKW